MFTGCGELDEFGKSCFEHFLSFDVDVMFSSLLVYNLLTKENVVDNIRQYKIWFVISQRKFRFSNEEFCLVSGLKFRESSSVSTNGIVRVRNGILERYWPTMDVEVNGL